jgi:aminoglycoside phosphotransferase (APT) family kinase protein
LKDVLPPNATDVAVHDIHRLKEQGTNAVMYSFFLTYVSEGLKQRKDFILKMYREGCEKNGPKEFSLLKILKEYNIPVPTAYYFEADNRIMGKPFIIMEKIIGKTASDYLNDEVNAQIIVDKMAKILVRIHKLDPNCIQNSNVLQQQYELRQQGLLKIRFFINKRCINFLGFCPLPQRRFIAAVKRLEEVKPKKFRPALLHLDYGPDHVFVSNRRFIIVDWGLASIGDPAFDVAWTYHKLRLGREMAKMDLGEHFVKRYEKYMGQRLVNLQFCKDMAALEIAAIFGLSPFHAQASQFRNYAKLVDLTFGNIFGKLLGAKELHRLQRLMALHHTSIWSNIEYIQSYATRYLERDRYNTRN